MIKSELPTTKLQNPSPTYSTVYTLYTPIDIYIYRDVVSNKIQHYSQPNQ